MRRELVIDGVKVGDDHPPYVVAEVGSNHSGSASLAAAMFEAAHRRGANAVKLQKRDNRHLFTSVLYNQPYNNDNSFGTTYGEHREALELSESDYRNLKEIALRVGITMFATPFDEPSVDFLASLDVPAFKVASADMKNTPLIRRMAKHGKPLIISTGGGNLDDVKRAREAAGDAPVALLQCTAAYPCKADALHLRVIELYRSEFPEDVIGLSDHQDGICLGPAAYALGARIFEKHFTLDHGARGTDHAFSLEPAGLEQYIHNLRTTAAAMGDNHKRSLECEKNPLRKMAKSPYAKSDMPAGHLLSEDDIALKSPADFLPAHELYNLVGRRLKHEVRQDDPLLPEDVG